MFQVNLAGTIAKENVDGAQSAYTAAYKLFAVIDEAVTGSFGTVHHEGDATSSFSVAFSGDPLDEEHNDKVQTAFEESVRELRLIDPAIAGDFKSSDVNGIASGSAADVV